MVRWCSIRAEHDSLSAWWQRWLRQHRDTACQGKVGSVWQLNPGFHRFQRRDRAPISSARRFFSCACLWLLGKMYKSSIGCNDASEDPKQ